ncbi:hypothetical protein [Stakelama marina]|uniref:DUF3052 family protein n=1 Tax=Stakelama marina TaxID=2826939 RepID=A0A8T4IIN1_9SPHN|nr:hypothetical protein [Stakelama marina]MBR0552169.1 hypothetical protein [Stakelama marina]
MTDHKSPLARDLGFDRGMKVWFRDLPSAVRAALDPDRMEFDELAAPSQGIEGSLIFVEDRDTLAKELHAFHDLLAPAGFVWVAWQSGLDEESVREAARPCSLSPTDTAAIGDWTALKLSNRSGRDA